LGATSVEVVANAGETTAPTFESLTVDKTKATIEITDTIDVTKITLTSESINNGADIKISVFLGNKDGMDTKVTNTPLVIILNDGAKITIPVGETTGSITIPNPAPNGGVVTYSISETTGGNYEALDKNSTTTVVTKDTVPPTVTITGSTVSESNTGTVTGNKTIGTVTISFNKPLTEDLTITLNNGQKIDFKVGDTTKTIEVETSRVDDAYKQGTTTETVSIASTSNSKIDITDKTATITINDDVDPIDVTVTAVVTTPKVIDVNTKTDGTTGVTIKAYGSDGKETNLTTITGTNHDGFGVETKVNGKSVNNSNGDTKELGVGEKIVVEFTDKDVNSLDVSFAWRNNHETAKLTFINDGKIVGYATVTGDGSSTTKAIVTYYDENGEILKVVNAKGSSDKVDELFTFELPDSNGGIVSFDTVEFSAPKTVDDYLINSIVYKEVVNTSITDVLTDGGKVTFNIQVDENYPPQGKATAIVEVNGKEYEVSLNATGRGTLELSSSDLGTDLSNVKVVVKEIKGGNYESENSTSAKFDFTTSGTGDNLSSSNDNINTYEDTAYILKVTDFGEYGEKVQEFKITELPTNGKLYLTVTTGETIIDKDGNKTIATEDTKVEISKDQIISLADIAAGKVVFEPYENSDENGSFKFQVGDGNGKLSTEYTTTIDVKAVADAPTVSISITPDTNNPTSTGSNGNGNSGSNENNGSSNIGATKPSLNISSDWWNGYNSKGDIVQSATYEKDEVNWSNNNGFTSGNDSVSVGKLEASIDTGAGDDNIYVSGNVNQSISVGDGNDKIFIEGSVGTNWTIDLGKGNNNLHTKSDVGLVNGGSGDDTVLVEGNTTNTVNLGAGNNELHIKGNTGGTITTGSGDDKVFIEKDAKNSIRLGAGNNELYIKGNAENTIDTGLGNDIVIVDGNAKNSVRLGDGNNELYIKGSAVDITTGTGADKVFVDGNISNYVNLGSGDDYLEIGGKLTANNAHLDGGDGQDALYLKDYTKQQYESDFVANYQSWRIKNFETITFKDGDTYKIDKDGNLGDKVEAKEYKYDITVNASLIDDDGSESLSKDENGNEIITLKNIPVGSTLYNGEVKEANKLTANPDGSYTVKVDESGNAKLSLTNKNEISDTDLNSIKASATSNEVNENDEVTDSATSTVDNILSTDINLDNLSSIISENGEINLANSKAENISLTLDDVIKLSGDDNVIKISGDNFDSVTFKDTVGENGQENNWSKVAGTDTDQGYDIYTNSGDPTIQVKVEQPISDGITN
ncbi:immunoglobulin-like domain-containing protein, partial [Aliarcobacter butzleri]|uniref:immunoglobulin-like domain-containing protein n=1 Tax=Aliarcobacter butzleri TaxID=28197 RepID=UPI002B24820F